MSSPKKKKKNSNIRDHYVQHRTWAEEMYENALHKVTKYSSSKEYSKKTKATRKKFDELNDIKDKWKSIASSSYKRLDAFDASGGDTACNCDFSDTETEEFYEQNAPS